MVPVISSVGYVPGEGADQLVNVNADTVAGNIAAAVGARGLVFLTDVEGVLGPAGLVPELSPATAVSWIEDGTISAGMIPKVEACLHAASLGVAARIIDGRSPGALARADVSGTLVIP
jgi:acetylglutamate kinase